MGVIQHDNTPGRLRGRKLQALRKRIFAISNNLCVLCLCEGRYSPARHLDHINPRFKDGTDDDTNLQALCLDCHKAKTRADLGQKERVAIGVDGYPIEHGRGGGVKQKVQSSGNRARQTSEVLIPKTPS